MSATDPLREALEDVERAAREVDAFFGGKPGRWTFERKVLGEDDGENAATALLSLHDCLTDADVARDAFAPGAEPEGCFSPDDLRRAINKLEGIAHAARSFTGVTEQEALLYDKGYDDALKHARKALAVLPAEPEAWEWRAIDGEGHRTDLRPSAASALREADASWTRIAADRWLERRHPGTAPGPWERVDPEPRPQDGGEG